MAQTNSLQPTLQHGTAAVSAASLFARITVVLVILGQMALPLHAQQSPQSLPSLGDPASAELSPSAERKLGERTMRDIRRDPDYISDPVLNDYLNRLAARLTENIARYAEGGIAPAIEVFGVRDRNINAFALPGGFIGMNTGLIAQANSESELASVLAHEIGHVTQRHIARSITNQNQSNLMAMAAVLLAIIAANKSPDAAQAAAAFGQGAAIQQQLNFSRDMEREADRIGLSMLQDGGLSAPSMLQFFERLQNANRLNDSGALPYLRTHPLTTERIGDLRARVGNRQPDPRVNVEFALISGRSRVLSESAVEGIRSVRDSCKGAKADTYAEKLAARYCEAYAAIKLRDWPAAEQSQAALAKLLNEAAQGARSLPEAQRAVALLKVEFAIAQERGTDALALLKPLQQAEPLSRPLAMLQAQAALVSPERDNLNAARQAMQSWVSVSRLDGEAWALLARLHSSAGEQAMALRANAEGHMVQQQWRAAVDMLEQARKTPGTNYFDASIIEARLREAKERLKEEMEEVRQRRASTS
jgi:predicted Zn-dependent protease